MKNLRFELAAYRERFALSQKQYVDKAERKQYNQLKEAGALPPDIEEDEIGFFRRIECDLSEDELHLLLKLRKLACLQTIRNCLVGMVIFALLTTILLLVNL